MIEFISPFSRTPLQRKGDSLVSQAGERFPIIKDVPRFVDSDNYASAFGLEWNRHRKTQLDSFTGINLSKVRLERCLGMPIERLKGKTVLEVGCGAGRFTELMVHAKALVHSIDLSVAVEANQENIGTQINYRIAQADLRNPPFSPNSFDFVFCLGVLQHTPSTEESIKSIYAMVKPGGILVIDHYIWSIKQVTKLMWLYRMILKRLSPTRSKKITDRLVDIFFPLHKAVGEFFPAQALLSRVSPCLVYFHYHPELSDELQLDWSRLDTYDQLTDYYKRLHTPSQIHRMLDSVGADNVRITRNGNGVEARCQKPKTA